jgi:RNA polymerase sigma factor (sigma-70 family)
MRYRQPTPSLENSWHLEPAKRNGDDLAEETPRGPRTVGKRSAVRSFLEIAGVVASSGAPVQPPSHEVRRLVDRCADGDRDAWDEFARRFHRRISLYVVRACGSVGASELATGQAASDLVQEVYVRLLAEDRRALRAWRGETEASFAAYLGRIVRSVVIDTARRVHCQKRAVSTVSLDDTGEDKSAPLAAPEATRPDNLLAERMTTERLRALLRSAANVMHTDRDVLVFQLYTLEGLTAREIASLPHLSLTVVNVEVIVQRTRSRLQRALETERRAADQRTDSTTRPCDEPR